MKLPEFLRELLRNKKRMCAAAAAAAVLLLLCLSGLSQTDSAGQTELPIVQARQTEEELEDAAEAFLADAQGVGRVRVMVTLDSLTQEEYAENVKTQRQNDKEEENAQYVILDNGSAGESGLLCKTTMPVIRGVAVLCEGGNDPLVRERVTDLLSAAFGIGSNRISVAAYAEP